MGSVGVGSEIEISDSEIGNRENRVMRSVNDPESDTSDTND